MVQRSVPITSPTSVTTPRLLGRYHVLDEIGRNAIGPIFLGRLEGPQGFQRWAAIRTLDDVRARDAAFRKLFFERAREGAKLLHANVATIFDVGEDGNVPWSASEYLHGERLSEVIDRIEIADTPMSWEIAARIMIDAAEGLHALHQLKSPDGVALHRVHGNVAPHVFIVTYDGICKIKGAFEPRRAQPDPRSVPYTAPEQLFSDEVGVASDVFALGVILWELTSGRHLFARTTDDETRAMIEAGLVPSIRERVDAVPRELDAIVNKALARKTSQRYATARELGRALEDLLFAKQQRVRQEDIGRYLRTVFADRYIEQESKLKEAADVTEVFRRSQHGLRAALPNLAPREEEEDGDGDETTVMPTTATNDDMDDADQTTAERPAAVLPGRGPMPPQRPVRAPPAYAPSPDSSPTQVRPPPHDPYADSGSLPTLVRPSELTPEPAPAPAPVMLPLKTLPLSPQVRSPQAPAYTPPRTSSGFLAEPSVTPSDPSGLPAPPVSEGSAVFVAPRRPLPSETGGGDTTAAMVRPRSTPPPPALHLRTQQTLSANDESVVAPPPRPREERTLTAAMPVPPAPPTVPRTSPDDRTLTGYDVQNALPSTGRMPVAQSTLPLGGGPRRADPNERTLTAYDVPAQTQMPTQPPMMPQAYPSVSPTNLPPLPPGHATASHSVDPRNGRKQVATVAFIGVGGGILLFLVLMFALRTPEAAPIPAASAHPIPTVSGKTSAVTTTTTTAPPKPTALVTATATATATAPPPTATIPTLDLTQPPPPRPTATTRPTSRPTARPTSPPPPPPTTPAVASPGKGFLTVMCRPTACDQVLDNGQDLGETPFFKKQLAVGKHVLTLRVNSPRAEKTVPVFILDGETTKINQDMSQ